MDTRDRGSAAVAGFTERARGQGVAISYRRALSLVLAAFALLIGLPCAQAGAFIYWANHGYSFGGAGQDTIGRAAENGTQVDQSFIKGASSPCGVAVDAAHLFWTNWSYGFGMTIGRSRLDGGGVDQIFARAPFGPGFPCGVAVDSSHIFWGTAASGQACDGPTVTPGTGGSVYRAGANGGAGQAFIPGKLVPTSVAVDATHIYWGNTSGGPGTIGRARLDGSQVDQDFISTAGTPCGVAVTARHIYWANGRSAIGRANLDGSRANQNFITGASFPCGVAVSAKHIFWTNTGLVTTEREGTIGRANLDGSNVQQRFITGAFLPCGIAVDQAEVHVANVVLNRRTGAATLKVAVSGAGTLRLTGAGVRAMVRNPRADGPLTLPIQAKGSKAQTLERAGTVLVKVRLSFTRPGSDSVSKTQSIRLVKRS